MDVDQASEDEILVIEGEDVAESDEEIIVISDDSDMGGVAAKEESNKEESSDDNGDSESLENLESIEQELGRTPQRKSKDKRGWMTLLIKCGELRFRYDQGDQARVNEL